MKQCLGLILALYLVNNPGHSDGPYAIPGIELRLIVCKASPNHFTIITEASHLKDLNLLIT